MSIEAGDLKMIAEQVLVNLGIVDYENLQITYAVKTEDKWKVSFEYEPHRGFSGGVIRKIGSFAVNAESGEIEGMWLDRSWK